MKATELIKDLGFLMKNTTLCLGDHQSVGGRAISKYDCDVDHYQICWVATVYDGSRWNMNAQRHRHLFINDPHSVMTKAIKDKNGILFRDSTSEGK